MPPIGKPFQKGQSGNPSGRPKDAELRELCRAETAENIRTLIAIRNNRKAPAAARIAAINSMFDRGYGKPTQAIAGPGGGPLWTLDAAALAKLSEDDIDRAIAIHNKLAAIVDAPGGEGAQEAGS